MEGMGKIKLYTYLHNPTQEYLKKTKCEKVSVYEATICYVVYFHNKSCQFLFSL